jgi:hypothetical protein
VKKTLIAATLLASSIALAPQASADPDVADFIKAVQADGIHGTPSAILTDGMGICQAFDKGYNGTQVVSLIIQSEGLRKDLAEKLMIDAVHYLCPENEPHGTATSYRAGDGNAWPAVLSDTTLPPANGGTWYGIIV